MSGQRDRVSEGEGTGTGLGRVETAGVVEEAQKDEREEDKGWRVEETGVEGGWDEDRERERERDAIRKARVVGEKEREEGKKKEKEEEREREGEGWRGGGQGGEGQKETELGGPTRCTCVTVRPRTRRRVLINQRAPRCRASFLRALLFSARRPRVEELVDAGGGPRGVGRSVAEEEAASRDLAQQDNPPS